MPSGPHCTAGILTVLLIQLAFIQAGASGTAAQAAACNGTAELVANHSTWRFESTARVCSNKTDSRTSYESEALPDADDVITLQGFHAGTPVAVGILGAVGLLQTQSRQALMLGL
mmetsp:Transcript_70040/g.130932  ORF Transcript_70040/g.130932 Transcript_70040/m.130932 type:complete len:115 (-) Transcript_70040:125-469(-)